MSRKRSTSNPIWPYLGILGCLFLLSLAAPRAWERRAQRESVAVRKELAPRTSPLATHVPLEAEEPVSLEAADESELAPREDLSEFGAPFPQPTLADEAPLAELIPPAPEYAEQVVEPDDLRLPLLELANLPLTPSAPAAEPEEEPRLPAPAPASQPSSAEVEPEREPVPESPIRPDSPAPPVPAPPAAAPLVPEPVEEQPPLEPAELEAVQPAWPLPRTLLEQLTSLIHEDGQLVWARRALQLVEELCHTDDVAQRKELLATLRQLSTRDSLQPGADASLQTQVIRVRYGLTRWLDLWDACGELGELSPSELFDPATGEEVRVQLAAFDTSARNHPEGAAWSAYLRLDDLRAAASERAGREQRRAAAQAVLTRMNSHELTDAQRSFIAGDLLGELRGSLESWVAEELAVEDLLAHVEQLEYSGLSEDATAVARDYEVIRLWNAEPAQRLATHLDTHYRNANLRVAVSGDLANRFVPQPGRIDAPVRDTVVNVPVRGHSTTFTQLSLRLVPDESRIRLGLEAHGTVDANTISDAGPARFRNRGQSTFLVRKLFVFGPRGLLVWPAIAEAENNYNYLVSMETDYDKVPLVGSLVRNIARSQHDEIRGLARRHTERTVAVRALNELDTEVEARLSEAEQRVQRRQLAMLDRLGLELVPISLSTTEQRVVGRLRLSGREQLGAHTPRPRAPSDSWLSMQVHQSALNNGLEALDLEGRSFELDQLFAWVGEKLGRADLSNQEDLPEDVRITFAEQDAIRLRALEDRIEITFSLAELTHQGSRWRDFQVRTHYAPAAEGNSPRFTRVDTIRLDGESMRGKIEFKLRAIFSKVLSKNRDLRLLPESITGEPRFRDLQITQFVVDDGWIGLAYSPRRVSSKVARKPE